MAYEYEHDVISELEQMGVDYQSNGYFNMSIEVQEIYRKAKAFDTFLKYKQHVEKYNNSDCHELERVFQGVIKEYEEDK